MSDFFEPPPPPPRRDPRERSLPPWMGPPAGTVPGVVPLELVMARTARFAVVVARVAAYPEGFEFEVLALAAPGEDEDDLPDAMLFGPRRHRRHRGGGEMPDDLLRIGVQFSDGRKATNTGGFPHFGPDLDKPPEAPVMRSGGGGGGGGRWHQSEWIWPLPPPGPLAFACEWPAAGIPLTRREISADLILDAAARAEVIFPEDEESLGGGRWTTYAPGPSRSR